MGSLNSTTFSFACETTMENYKNQIAAEINDLKDTQKQITPEEVDTIVLKFFEEYKTKIETDFKNKYQNDGRLVIIKNSCINSAKRKFDLLGKLCLKS